MEESKNYNQILKSTFVFGFIQVYNILVKVILNKVIALILGVEGIGYMGLYTISINLIKSICSFGVAQSIIRDVSESSSSNNTMYIRETFKIAFTLFLITSSFGVVVTVLGSGILSKFTFGSSIHYLAFILLSIAVFFNIFSDGIQSILKGLQEYRNIAYVNVISSTLGLVVSVPLFYLFREKGIVPSLVITSFIVFVCGVYYVKNKINFKFDKHLYYNKQARIILKMGLALMYLSLLGIITEFIVRVFISNYYGVNAVGLFLAGSTITTSYFGIVSNALTMDYYPRISKINKDNILINEELNRQALINVLLMGPLVYIFLIFSKQFVLILYSTDFITSLDYLKFAVIGSVITLCSNSLGIILLAKQDSKIFVFTVSITNAVNIAVSILFYYGYGLMGLGVGTILLGLIHYFIMSSIMSRKYSIRLERKILYFVGVNILFYVLILAIGLLESRSVKFLCMGILTLFYFMYEYTILKRNIGLNFLKNIIRQK